MEKLFKLKEHGTNVRTEILAGVTTFMTMAYILAVNPSILSDAGMDSSAVFIATCLASCVASILMAAFANLPFVLSAGMGLNAYLAYTVVLGMGYSWEWALGAVFVEGIIFIILSLTNVREAIFNAIPIVLKTAVSAGIGLFIAFIGLQNAKIVVDGATLVEMFSWKGEGVSFQQEGITVLLALIGIIITGFLVVKGVKGNILWGILITWVLGMICQVVGLYVPNPDAGWYSLFPNFSQGLANFSSLGNTAFKLQFPHNGGELLNFIVVLFSFLFVDLFDTLGTLIGVLAKAKMLDEEGRLPGIKGALLADAIGTTFGALMGTSTVTTFVESASGVAEGGRTGLTAVTAAILFFLAMFLSPIFLAIPSFATAPALIIVGFLMMQNVNEIDFNNLLDAIPAFLCIIAMPFCYSIAEGIGWGMIAYAAMYLLTGKGKKVHPILYVVSVLFILKYIFL